MTFHVEELTLELIHALKPLVPRIRRNDRSLADQIVRAASSIALNIAEAQYSDPGNRRARFYSAAGSANETRSALRVAIAWGYFAEPDAAGAAALLHRIVPMLWKLARG
jgi:four helix bundle protein